MQASTKMVMTPEEYLETRMQGTVQERILRRRSIRHGGCQSLPYLDRGQYRLPLRGPAQGPRCTVHPNDLRVKVTPSGLYTYPDVVVVCGTPRYEDRQKDTLLNPYILVVGSFGLRQRPLIVARSSLCIGLSSR